MKVWTKSIVSLLCLGSLLLLTGCGKEATLEPPKIYFGQAVCDVCGMIVSDERFSAAEVVIRDGQVVVRAFDDTGEVFGLTVPVGVEYAWYVHDMYSLEWVDARDAVYLRSDELHTPMGLGIAAFATRAAAESAQAELGGEVLVFDDLWVSQP